MTSSQVRAIYDRFFRLGGPPPRSQKPWQYRRKETSLRLEGCFLLAEMVITRDAKRVLDLGSGLTTILLRELQRGHDMLVVTTDTSERWLTVTKKELVRDNLRTDECYTQDEFEAKTWEPFDLISVDCGNLAYRVSLAPKLAEWCAPNGMLVLDDWNMHPFPVEMTNALTELGFTVTERKDTRDMCDQWMALAERRAA